jgi:hypothetical protein
MRGSESRRGSFGVGFRSQTEPSPSSRLPVSSSWVIRRLNRLRQREGQLTARFLPNLAGRIKYADGIPHTDLDSQRWVAC